MGEVVLNIAAAPDGLGQVDALRADLAEHVGPTSFAESAAADGAKGMTAITATTLVVTLLGTPAVVALVNVLRSYLERMIEIEVTTERGTVKLKLPAGNALSAEDIRRALASVLGPA